MTQPIECHMHADLSPEPQYPCKQRGLAVQVVTPEMQITGTSFLCKTSKTSKTLKPVGQSAWLNLWTSGPVRDPASKNKHGEWSRKDIWHCPLPHSVLACTCMCISIHSYTLTLMYTMHIQQKPHAPPLPNTTPPQNKTKLNWCCQKNWKIAFLGLGELKLGHHLPITFQTTKENQKNIKRDFNETGE